MDFKALRDGMEMLENSACIRRLLWACIAVAGGYVVLFGLDALLAAIRWW